MTVKSIAEQVNIDRDLVRKILTEDPDIRNLCANIRNILRENRRLTVRSIAE